MKKDKLIRLIDNFLENEVETRIFNRGKRIKQNKLIKNLKIENDTIKALVYSENFYKIVYRVEVNYDDLTIYDAYCNCPYYDTCKHIVAVLLEVKERLKREGNEGKEEDIRSILEGLPKEELIWLIQYLNGESNLLSKIVELKYKKGSEKDYLKQIEKVFLNRLSSLLKYYYDYDYEVINEKLETILNWVEDEINFLIDLNQYELAYKSINLVNTLLNDYIENNKVDIDYIDEFLDKFDYMYYRILTKLIDTDISNQILKDLKEKYTEQKYFSYYHLLPLIKSVKTKEELEDFLNFIEDKHIDEKSIEILLPRVKLFLPERYKEIEKKLKK